MQGGASAQDHATNPKPRRSSRETYRVLERLVTDLYPHATVTSGKRSPQHNRDVGGVANSYHVTGQGLDVTGLSAADRAELKDQLEAMGVQLDEFLYHRVRGGGLHLHIASTHVPDELYGDEMPPADSGDAAFDPEDDTAPQEDHRSGMGIADLVAGRKAPKETVSGFSAGVLGFGDSATFGFLDEAGAVADSILGGNQKTIWDGSSFSDAYDANVAANRQALKDARDEHPWAYGAGGIAGGFIPISRAGKIAMASKAALRTKLARATAEGTAMGSLYGFGSDEGDPLDRLDGAAVGAVGGAAAGLGLQSAGIAAGKALKPVAERIVPKLMQQRFEARQADNVYRQYDREIATDLDKLVRNVTASKSAKTKLTKTQKTTLVDRIAELEASYLPYDDIKALAIKGSAKAKLTKALNDRHLLDEDDISALADGTPAGDAVADAIRRARRLYSLVPQVAGQSSPVAGRFLAEALGGSIGYKLGGPLGGAVGTAAAKKLTRSAKSTADRALEVAADAEKFGKMPHETWGAPHKPQDALRKLADEARDAPFIAKQETERLVAEGRKVAMQNAKDDVRPGGGLRGLIYDRAGLLPSQQDAGALAALKDGKISQEHFDAFLSNPEALMEGKVGLSLMDRLATMADDGKLSRDPAWSPPAATPAPAAPSLDAQGQPIRSLEAYRAGAAKHIARETDLMRQLDEIDPIRGALADGVPIRASEMGELSDADAARAVGIKAELASMKAPRKGAQNGS